MIWPSRAFGGAWVAEDEPQEIWTSARGERNGGEVTETAAYWEIPALENAALVAAPWLERNTDTFDGWRAEALVGLKRSVFAEGPNVMSLQAAALWSSHPPLGCSEGGAELRWLGGRSFEGGFVNLEAAGRVLSGGCSGERLELTVGYRPNERWLALGQVFHDGALGGEDTVKLQLSLVRHHAMGRGLQIGLRSRIDGGPPEPAVVLAFWDRPGG